ncbi:MAG TPA: hypothetical protein VF183_07380 [Acidimicrobiales bacterium]
MTDREFLETCVDNWSWDDFHVDEKTGHFRIKWANAAGFVCTVWVRGDGFPVSIEIDIPPEHRPNGVVVWPGAINAQVAPWQFKGNHVRMHQRNTSWARQRMDELDVISTVGMLPSPSTMLDFQNEVNDLIARVMREIAEAQIAARARRLADKVPR